jgi:hypothetical protein
MSNEEETSVITKETVKPELKIDLVNDLETAENNNSTTEDTLNDAGNSSIFYNASIYSVEQNESKTIESNEEAAEETEQQQNEEVEVEEKTVADAKLAVEIVEDVSEESEKTEIEKVESVEVIAAEPEKDTEKESVAAVEDEKPKDLNKEDILNELKKLDLESTGFLNTTDIKELADKLQVNLKFENDDLNKKLESLEKNENGQVNYVELVNSL